MTYAPFATLKPDDGYRIEEVVIGDPAAPAAVSLHVTARFAGSLVNPALAPDQPGTLELFAVEAPTPADLGAACRLRLVLEAVARYLTTGGDLAALQAVLGRIAPLVPGTIVYPGFHLLDTGLNTDNEYEHLFVADAGDAAVLWVEGLTGFIDLTTKEAIRDAQQAAEAAAETAATSRTRAGQAGDDPLFDPPDRGLPQLPG